MTSAEVEEIKRHFGVVAEGLEKSIKVVAEAVTQLDARMDRELGSLREEMRASFGEVKAMIKFSYAELDRRMVCELRGPASKIRSVVIRRPALLRPADFS
jgi:hypothetical protein